MLKIDRSFLMVCMVFACILNVPYAHAAIRVGVGETIITPPVGIPLYGYARAKVSDGVHDDLHARSLVIEGSNGTSTVFMTLSLCDLSRPLFDLIRQGVNRKTGIPVENIVIACTHTHSGPELDTQNDGFLKEIVTASFQNTGTQNVSNAPAPPGSPLEKPSVAYTKMMVERAIESAVIAWKNRAPGRIGFGSGIARELGKNDRRMQYGGMHPDPEVGIIKVEDTKGKLIGVAFNYGCHPSTLDKYNYKFTEDWPYYSIKGLKEKLGKNVWVAYYQSAQGDAKVGYTAELSATGAKMDIRTFEFAEYKGNMMVDAVMKVLPSIKTSPDADIAISEKNYDLPARDGYRLTEAEAQKQADAANAAMEEAEKRTDIYGRRVIEAFRVENYLAGLRLSAAKAFNDPNRPRTIPTVQQAVRIGDTVFVTFPGEVFTEIGLKVKQRSPLEKTFIFGLAGAFDNYLPTAEEFKEEGYAALISPYSPNAEQVLIDTSLELIGKVQKKQ